MLFRKYFHLEEDLFLLEEQYKCRASHFLLTECENSFLFSTNKVACRKVVQGRRSRSGSFSSCTLNPMQSIFSHILLQSETAASAASSSKLFFTNVERDSAFQVNPGNFECRLYSRRYVSTRFVFLALQTTSASLEPLKWLGTFEQTRLQGLFYCSKEKEDAPSADSWQFTAFEFN